MSILDVIAILISLTALFAYINCRFINLPTTIGLLLSALTLSLGILLLSKLGLHFEDDARRLLSHVDFNMALMEGMLSALLFAGALHVNVDELKKQMWVVAILASVGVVTSTILVGFAAYGIFSLLDLDIPLIYCLLFGSLISPTDPIAVLGILKRLGVPKSLETKIAGESLFNDGVAIVVFISMLGIAVGGHGEHGQVTAGSLALLFVEEAIGGAVFGFVIGYVTYRMLARIDNYQVEVLLTLALVFGGYALAAALHMSAPIAIVVAGLLIGNKGRNCAMTDETREHLDNFWELIDEILNAILFVLIGLEVLILSFKPEYFWAGLIMIPVVLLARFIAVGSPIYIMRRLQQTFTPRTVRILTWGGLRGGISIALALTLPAGEARETILVITYIVVVFSIIVQGLTISKLITEGEAAT